MLLVVAFGAHGTQHHADQVPLQGLRRNISQEKAHYQFCREMFQIRILPPQIEHSAKQKQANDVRLADIGELQPPALHPLGGKQMEYGI